MNVTTPIPEKPTWVKDIENFPVFRLDTFGGAILYYFTDSDKLASLSAIALKLERTKKVAAEKIEKLRGVPKEDLEDGTQKLLVEYQIVNGYKVTLKDDSVSYISPDDIDQYLKNPTIPNMLK